MKTYICSAKRSPVGSFLGSLSSVSATELGAAVVRELIDDLSVVDEVVMGCVLSAGLGQAPARQVALKAGLSNAVSAMTINKVCSSGLKAVLLAADSIKLGRSRIVVAGGIESMSQAPRLLGDSRLGAKFGDVKLVDSMISDGLWDVYNDFHMGSAAEMCAERYNLSREEQDSFALRSYSLAQKSIADGLFADEIVPVQTRKLLVSEDEEPGKLNADKVPGLRPAFKKDGTVTAANASSLNDGAAAVVLASEEAVQEFGLTPLVEVVSEGYHSHEPEWFTTAPVGAVKNALSQAKLDVSNIDLFELNEAFSVVGLACSRDLKLEPDKVNVRGGSVAIGHPIGASGARILVTLVHTMLQEKKEFGVCGICNGGGEASAVVLKAVS